MHGNDWNPAISIDAQDKKDWPELPHIFIWKIIGVIDSYISSMPSHAWKHPTWRDNFPRMAVQGTHS